jgi:hypothetical protein
MRTVHGYGYVVAMNVLSTLLHVAEIESLIDANRHADERTICCA